MVVVVAILGFLAGLGLAMWRFSVYALVPITLIAWLGLAAILSTAGIDIYTTVKVIIVWTVCLDAGYLLAAIFLPELKPYRCPFLSSLRKSVSAGRQAETRDSRTPPEANEGLDHRTRL